MNPDVGGEVEASTGRQIASATGREARGAAARVGWALVESSGVTPRGAENCGAEDRPETIEPGSNGCEIEPGSVCRDAKIRTLARSASRTPHDP